MDTEEKITYLKQNVRANDIKSMLLLGELYEQVKPDHTLAMKMYSMAYRKARDPYMKEIAAAYLASHYLESTDPDDWEQAETVIRNAIQNGAYFAPSAYLIGDMQLYGKVYRQWDHSAYESYVVAKDIVYTTEENRRFLGQVLMRFGEIYAKGIYIPADPDKAEAYFYEAKTILTAQAENHDVFAIRALKRLKESVDI